MLLTVHCRIDNVPHPTLRHARTLTFNTTQAIDRHSDKYNRTGIFCAGNTAQREREIEKSLRWGRRTKTVIFSRRKKCPMCVGPFGNLKAFRKLCGALCSGRKPTSCHARYRLNLFSGRTPASTLTVSFQGSRLLGQSRSHLM